MKSQLRFCLESAAQEGPEGHNNSLVDKSASVRKEILTTKPRAKTRTKITAGGIEGIFAEKNYGRRKDEQSQVLLLPVRVIFARCDISMGTFLQEIFYPKPTTLTPDIRGCVATVLLPTRCVKVIL